MMFAGRIKVSAVLLLGLLAVSLLSDLAEGRGRGGGGRGGGGFGRGGSFGRSRGSSGRGGWGSRSRANSYPKQQWGSSSSAARTVGYGTRAAAAGSSRGVPVNSFRTRGYGTAYGTRFGGPGAGGGRYNEALLGRKYVGMGVRPGFLGGAATGAFTTMAVMGVYHRYWQYKMLMFMHTTGGPYNDPYYRNYYQQGRCMDGCPAAARCLYGICECNPSLVQFYGQCVTQQEYLTRVNNYDNGPDANLGVSCISSAKCQDVDINMICNMDDDGVEGKCECRRDMRWNDELGQCQLYLDVDCGDFTYDTPVSPAVLDAANVTLESGQDVQEELDDYSTPTPNGSLANSLLTGIDPSQADERDIREAFCRDVDSFSFEFARDDVGNSGSDGLPMALSIIIPLGLIILAFGLLVKVAGALKRSINLRRQRMAAMESRGGTTNNFSDVPQETKFNGASPSTTHPNPSA